MRTITNVMQEKPSVLLRRAATTETPAFGKYGIQEGGAVCSLTYLGLRAGLDCRGEYETLAQIEAITQMYGLPTFIGVNEYSCGSYIIEHHDGNSERTEFHGGFLQAAAALEAIGY